MDDPIGWVPDAPHLHSALTVRTAQGVSPGALLIALPVGQGSDDLHGPLNDALDCGQGLLNQVLDLDQCFGGLHAVIPDALKAFGKDMLYHPADKRIDLHRFPLDLLALVGTVVIGDPLAIIPVDAAYRDRRTHDVFREIRRQALIPRGDIAFLDIGHKAMRISRVTGIDEAIDLVGLRRLPQHGQQMPLPLFAQHRIR
jgi:hypothetical protein